MISNYAGLKQAYFVHMTPRVVRVGDYSDFRFNVSGIVPAQTHLVLTFQAGVSLPASGELVCSFNGILARRCVATVASPLTIEIYAPATVLFAAATVYQLEVTSNCGANTGLLFSTAGKFLAKLTSPMADASEVFIPYEVYPTAQFTNAILSLTFENAIDSASADLASLFVDITPSVAIPTDGRIVIAFPHKNED